MCRNIKPLFNFLPPATDDEVKEASLQFVRKISGFRKPSKVNEVAVDEAVQKITAEIKMLLNTLKTETKARDRVLYEQKQMELSKKRFS